MADPANSVAVATGSLIVTGTLTSFIAAEYDLFILGGDVAAIASRDSTTQITLKQPWAGDTVTGATTWAIANTGPYWQSTVAINQQLSELLGKFEAGPIKWDASGPLSGRSAYDGQPKDFVYLSLAPAPFTLFVKLSSAIGDWSAGQILAQKADSTAQSEAARDLAQQAAGVATSNAGVATTQAGIAAGAAGTATTQAGIATGAASTATSQAGAAAGSASTSSSKADVATGAASTATSQAALAQSTVATGRVAYDLLSQLNANLSPADGAQGEVRKDNANNGTYTKIGASGTGSWRFDTAATVPSLDARTKGQARTIREFGGDPSLANNGDALGQARAATPVGGIIRLPGKAGAAYNFPDGIQMADRLFDPDPGVITNAVSDFSAGKVTRSFLVKRNQSGVVDHHYFTPDVDRSPTDKQQFLSPESCERSDYSLISQFDARLYVDAPWDVDAQTAFSPAGTDTSAAVWTAPANWRGVLTPLRAGQEIGGVFTASTDPGLTRAAVVEGSNGRAWLYGGGGALTLSSKPYGANRVTAASSVNWPENGNDPAWFNAYSLWTIRAASDSKIDVLLNGLVITTVDLAALNIGFILRAGLMTYGSGVNGTAGVAQMYRATRSFRRGNPNITLGVIGDSISTDYFHGNWPRFVSEWLDGSAGLRVVGIDNRAVSGETAGQQLARLQTVGVGSMTDAVVYIGTNDIRYGTATATTIADVSSILDIMQAANIVVTMVIPYLYYDQTHVPGLYGAQAANGEKGAPTRAALMLLGAARGVRVVDLQQITGQIRASLGDQLSSFLRDNLHPMIFGSKVLARAIAEGVVMARAAITRGTPDRAIPPTWLQNGWTNATSQPLRFTIHESGQFQFGGILAIPSSTRADGTLIVQLPSVFWPRRQYQFAGWTEGNRPVLILVGLVGNVSVYGVSAGGTNVYFESPPWPLA